VVNTVILDFFFRPEGNSCEMDAEVEVTDPAGNVTIFPAPVTTCTGNDAIFQFLLPVASVPANGGVWKLRFRDIDDQNPVAAGPPAPFTPDGTEYSVRFGRITYNITIDPDCGPMAFHENDNPQVVDNQNIADEVVIDDIAIDEVQQQADFKLFPVPTTGRLNVEYAALQDGDIYIEIVDANGKAMYTQISNVLKGTNMLNMEVFDLPGGLYYMTIRDGSGYVQTKPFTKLSP